MSGYLAGCDSTFQITSPPEARVSTHVGVGLTGAIHEYVRHTDSAWANGRLEAGHRWPGLSPINPNFQSLSCETEDRAHPQTEPVLQAQYDAVLAWGLSMRQLYPSIRYLVAHRAISPATRSCPGARWLDTGRFDDLARDLQLEAIA